METWLTLSARPICSMAAALSPPPMMVMAPLPVAAATAWAIALVPAANWGYLEDAHRAVPDDGLGLGDLGLEQVAGLGADVQAAASRPGCCRLRRRWSAVGLEFRRRRRCPPADDSSLPPALASRLLGQVHLVGLDEALADGLALGQEEGVGHRAADEDACRTLPQQVLDDVDLVGDLGPAEDRHERPGGLGDGVAEELEFLLDQEADDAGLPCSAWADAERGGVLAVGGAEGVVDVDVAELGQLLGESSGSFFSSSLWKRRFSSSSTSPSFRAATWLSPSGRCSRWRTCTGLPSSSPSRSATGRHASTWGRARPWAGRGGS